MFSEFQAADIAAQLSGMRGLPREVEMARAAVVNLST
jgi:hypothetical protein